MYCKKCGQKLDSDAKFCKKCGAATAEYSKPQVKRSSNLNAKKSLLIISTSLIAITLIAAGYYYKFYRPNQVARLEKEDQKLKLEKKNYEKANRKLHEEFALDDGRKIKPDHVNIFDQKNNFSTTREVQVWILGPDKDNEFKDMKLLNRDSVEVGQQYKRELGSLYVFAVETEDSKEYILSFPDGNKVRLSPYEYQLFDKSKQSSSDYSPNSSTSNTHCTSYEWQALNATDTDCYTY